MNAATIGGETATKLQKRLNSEIAGSDVAAPTEPNPSIPLSHTDFEKMMEEESR